MVAVRQIEPADLLALSFAIRLATNAATDFASYKPLKAKGVKDMMGALVVGSVAAIAANVAPDVLGAARGVFGVGDGSGGDDDGGGGGSGECNQNEYLSLLLQSSLP